MDLNRHISPKIYKWSTSTWKMLDIINYLQIKTTRRDHLTPIRMATVQKRIPWGCLHRQSCHLQIGTVVLSFQCVCLFIFLALVSTSSRMVYISGESRYQCLVPHLREKVDIHKYDQLIFDKGRKAIQWRKDSVFTVLEQLVINRQIYEPQPKVFTSYKD